MYSPAHVEGDVKQRGEVSSQPAAWERPKRGVHFADLSPHWVWDDGVWGVTRTRVSVHDKLKQTDGIMRRLTDGQIKAKM